MAEQRLVPSDILNANNVDEYMRTCLHEACTLIKKDLQSYIRDNHYVSGNLMRAIKFRVIKRAKGYQGRIFIDEDNLVEKNNSLPYSDFILNGTKSFDMSQSRSLPSGRAKCMRAFDKERNKFFFTKRKGINPDNFFDRIIAEDKYLIDDIFENNMEMLNDGSK